MSARLRRRGVFCEAMEPRLVLAATPVVVDLLAVYTSAAATQVGGDAHVISLIQTSVDTMNQALINSNVSITIRLVGAEPISYTSSGDVYTDRVRLETAGDGYLDTVFARRNAYGADLVTLISDGYGGGNADLPSSLTDPNNPNLTFSANFVSGMGPGFLTLAHELGHNLGAGHERDNTVQYAPGIFPYSFGYHFGISTPNLTATYNDIMSYAHDGDQPLISYANPNVLFNGVPTGVPIGDPNSADIADTFTLTAPMVAAYRSVVVADTAGPTAKVFELNRNGSSLDFVIRYTDDSGIDLSTIGAGDVTMSGPGGFAIPAMYVSMDHPTVAGAFKFVTYHVTLPATNPPTASLSFNLLSGAVKDIYGHAAVAGAMGNHTAYYAGYSYAWALPLGTLATSTHTEMGGLTPDTTNAIYSFTLAQAATVSATLTGLSADANVFLAADTNHNGQFDGNAEILTNTGYNAGTADEGVTATLAAGTYYVYVYLPVGTVTTPYTLSVRQYTDVTAPTGVADTKDLKTAGAPYVDFAVTYTDDQMLNGVSARYDGAVDIHAVLDNGANYTFYYYPDPNLNSSYADAPTKTIYFRIFGDQNNGFTTSDNGTYTLSVHDSGSNPRVRDAVGNNIPVGLALGSFQIAIGTADTTVPTASLSAAPPVPGLTSWSFNVVYKDNVGLDASSLDNSDVRVTGPGGYNQAATFVSAVPMTNIGGAYLATYSVTAPGGYWEGTDDGAYSVSVQANQVRDGAGNFVVAGSLGSVTAASPNLVALAGPVAASLVGTGSADTMRVDADANFVYFTLNDSVLYFVPKALVPRINVAGLGGDDSIDYQSGVMTGTITAGSGNDSLTVSGGTFTLDGDVGAAALAATVSGGNLVLNTTQHLSSLTIGAGRRVSIVSGGAKVLVTKGLAVSGVLDVADDSVVIDYAGASPAVGVRSLLASGYAGGAWNGSAGIVASTAAGTTNHGIGYAEASDMGVTSFAGVTVDGTALLLKYTYAGDANLNGKIDSDDFALADRGKAKGLGAWVFGDFDYSGLTNAADLTILDRSLKATQTPEPETVVVPAVTVEEEPAVVEPVVVQPVVVAPAAVPMVTVVKRGKSVALTVKPGGVAINKAKPVRYAIDWNGDGRVDQVVTGKVIATVTHKFASKGVFNVRVAIQDATGRRIGERRSLVVRV